MKEKIEKFGKKKLILIVTFLLLVIIILFGGAFVYNKFFYKRSYNEIEDIMLSATKSYFEKHPDRLPTNINDTISLSDNDLVAAEEMKSITEYLKDESINCTGNVLVTNVNGKYRYTTSLDCGNQYKSKKFIDYIKNTVPIVESGNGLYNINEELIYRGDNVQNYMSFSNKLYRIVKFTEDQAVIILTEKLESIAWDDRYNVEKESSVGINDYSVSRIKEYLDTLYEGTSLISSDNRLLVVAHNLNVGKRNSKDTDKTGSLEGAAIMENQFIGLLPLNDYLVASLDSNCTTSTSASCMNYNYLSKYSYSWWTMTASSLNTYKVFKIDGSVSLTSASSNGYVRPVLYLAKDAIYVSGDGSKDNPYVVK